MLNLLEPIFDGSLIRLPRSKELLCPGTFVLFSHPGVDGGDLIDVGRIMRSSKSSDDRVTINIFRPPLPEEQIQSLTHTCLYELMQVVQTTEVVEIPPIHIIDVSFLFSYLSIMDDSNMLKVSGMKLVRVLRGRVHNSRFEEVFTPSFPLNYESFFHCYHLNDDLGYKRWSEVILPVQGLISRLLCCSFLGQGDNFCRRRSEALQFTNYQWGWLSSFFSSHGSPPCNVALSRRSKHLLVCPTAVYANSIQSTCSLIRCETAAQ
jgi:hypothetical protein